MLSNQVVASVQTLHSKLNRNRVLVSALVCLALTSYFALGFILAWDSSPVLALITLMLGFLAAAFLLLKLKTFGAQTIYQAGAALDSHYNSKERVVTVLDLNQSNANDPRIEYITDQLSPSLAQVDLASLAPLKIPKPLKLISYTLPLIWIVIIYLLLRTPPQTELGALAAELEQLIEEQGDSLPGDVKSALDSLVSEIQQGQGGSSAAVSEAISAAHSAIDRAENSQDSKSSQGGQGESQEQQPEQQDQSASSSQSSAEEKNSEQQSAEEKKQESKEQGGEKGGSGGEPENSQNQHSQEQKGKDQSQQGGSKGGEKDNKEQGDQKGEGEKGKDSSQTQTPQKGDQESKQSAGEPQNQKGEGQKSSQPEGEKQGDNKGEGTESEKKQQDGKPQEQSGKGSEPGKQDSKDQGEKGGQGDQQQGGEKPEEQGGKGEKSGEQDSSGKGDKQGDGKQESQAMNQAKETLNKMQQAAEQADNQQQSKGAESRSPGEGKEGEDQPQAGQDSGKSKTPQDQKGSTPGEKGDPNNSQAKDSGKRDNKIITDNPAAAQTSSDTAERFGDKPSSGASGSNPATLDETQIGNPDEKIDERYTGEDSKRELNQDETKLKTKLSDVKLGKPEPIKNEDEQPIPLEYRDLLR